MRAITQLTHQINRFNIVETGFHRYGQLTICLIVIVSLVLFIWKYYKHRQLSGSPANSSNSIPHSLVCRKT